MENVLQPVHAGVAANWAERRVAEAAHQSSTACASGHAARVCSFMPTLPDNHDPHCNGLHVSGTLLDHADRLMVVSRFYYHHAEPDYLMLAQWLPQTEDKLPANATHQACGREKPQFLCSCGPAGNISRL